MGLIGNRREQAEETLRDELVTEGRCPECGGPALWRYERPTQRLDQAQRAERELASIECGVCDGDPNQDR